MSQPSPSNTKPPQTQPRQPGVENDMQPRPATAPHFAGSGRLADKVALISGGDSGIGRACAYLFAREGADVAFVYRDEDEDAAETVDGIRAEGRDALAIRGDLGDRATAGRVVGETVERFGRLDVLVNNAAEQHPVERLEDIDEAVLERTFRTNVHGVFWLTQAALPHMGEGATVVNTTSVTAYRGSRHLVDYAATRGAVVAFTRSLAQQVVDRGIRVNAVAPGPVWTPLIPASFDADHVGSFGGNVPMDRPGEPNEIAPCHLFLACHDSSYMSGQVLHPNGGVVIGG
jgi:NAD(P)-dependent dehydrogenase (short-subunit alcohol dehydrogenase family)